MAQMFGWRRRAESFASRSKRFWLAGSVRVRNLRAVQRLSFRSHAFHTWPIPPWPSIATRTYWFTTFAGSRARSSSSGGGASADLRTAEASALTDGFVFAAAPEGAAETDGRSDSGLSLRVGTADSRTVVAGTQRCPGSEPSGALQWGQ